MSRELIDAAGQQARPCKRCGRTLVFVRDAEGKLHPLDAVAPVFSVRPDANGQPIAVRTMIAAVSHFATCPAANEFSSKRKGAA